MSPLSLANPPLWRQVLPYGALLAFALLIYFYFPDQLPLAARIAALAIFVMSLDLVVGYGGLATLGHSALYGVGAYAAGLLATHLSANPGTPISHARCRSLRLSIHHISRVRSLARTLSKLAALNEKRFFASPFYR